MILRGTLGFYHLAPGFPWARGGIATNCSERREAMADQSQEPVPFMQQVLDNPILLLIIGVVFPTVVYTVWGVVETLAIPMGQ